MKTNDEKRVISLSERLKSAAREEIEAEKTLSEIGWSKDLAVILTLLQSNFDDLHGTWCPGNLGHVAKSDSDIREEYRVKAQSLAEKIHHELGAEKHDIEFTTDGDIVLSWRHRTCTYVWTP